MPATVFKSIHDLRTQADIRNEQLVVTSGGFDPMHVGHLRCLQVSSDIARDHSNRTKLAVIVNGDGFLLRKKGFAFMPEVERLEIIAGVAGVDYVVSWDDGGQTVTGAIEILKPIMFTKGGDRDAAANVPEFDLCEKIGCQVLFGVGGGKIQSSSDLVKAIRKS
jgi:bifunctional ADP-heptose synthase (sugar kinase/adenylyltransferase)